MALFLTIVLIVSSALLAALLYAKHWELSRGRLLFSAFRPHTAAFFHRCFVAVERHAPEFVRALAERAAREVRVGARSGAARAILVAETYLERTLHGLRERTSSRGIPGEASAFLREVAEHKRKLSAQVRARGATAAK